MDLSKVSTKDLRREVDNRQKLEEKARADAFRAGNPCPNCGGDPVSLETKMVEEFRFAPRDSEDRPILYAPYEMGIVKGGRYESCLTCENGHTTFTDEIVWFEK